MVRAIKSKPAAALNKGESLLWLPGPTEVEPWECWGLRAGEARLLETGTTPRPNRSGALLALPVAEVFCVPLWLNETDSAKITEMIPLQLELRGLLPRSEPVVFDWSVALKESTRTLVVVGVLPQLLPEEIREGAHSLFDLSARCFALPEDALVLWQEQNRLVLAVTRGKNLVYFQALTVNGITPAVLQDLNCVRATLAMQEVAPSPRQIVTWCDLTPSECDSLQKTLQLPVQKQARPHPGRPSPAWKLIPASVTRRRQSQDRRRWQARALALLGLVYLLVVAGLFTRILVTRSHVRDLETWTTQHAQALAEVRQAQAAWKELRPVVDEKSYPLELLLETAQAIPADQLHLTLFEASDGHLLIKGEAKDVSAAFQFLDHLKKDPSFAAYTWEMAQPHLLPNDLAQLQIEGTRSPGALP